MKGTIKTLILFSLISLFKTNLLAQTTLSTTITINQNWVNTNSGPWTISGSNITVTFGENLTISNLLQNFIILGSNVTINGANKIITIDGLTNFSGLIDASNTNASSAEIKNIGVETVNSSSTGGNSGYISKASNKATISNCYATGLIRNYNSGGITGDYNSGLIRNCYTTGDLSDYTGGIVGPYNSGIVTNCYTTGFIHGSTAGGIAGHNSSGIIRNCYTTGRIGAGSGEAGIVFNTINNGIIDRCLSTGVTWTGNEVGISRSPSTNSIGLGTGAPWNTINANSVLIGVGSIWNTSATPYTLTFVVSPPSLLLTPPLATLTSNCAGLSSNPSSFGIEGSDLVADVIVNAPTGFEIATVSNTSYVSSISLSRNESNSVSSTLYVRLTTSAPNGISGTISASTTGAESATTVSSTLVNAPTFLAASYTLCAGAYYPLSLTIDANSALMNSGWSTASSTISINSSGFINAGTVAGNYTITYTDACAQTATATIVVNNSENDASLILDGQASYKFNNTPQGPTADIFTGYKGFTYSSTNKPTKTGFYTANNLSGNNAGCPVKFYIFRCTTCNN